MRHHADADGTIVNFEARIVLDGGAYRVVELPRARQRRVLRGRPVPRAERRSWRLAVRTNNPPCGAMRGFGVGAGVLRARGADGQARRGVRARPGRAAAAQRARDPATSCSPASVIEGVLPVARGDPRVRRAARCRRRGRRRRDRAVPAARAAPPTPADVRRGVGFAVGVQEPHVRRGLRGRLDRALPARRRRWPTITCAAAEVGQGFVTLAAADRAHGARRRRGRARAGRHVDRLGGFHVGEPPDDDVGRRGRAACRAVRDAAVRARRRAHGVDRRDLAVDGDRRRRHWASCALPSPTSTAVSASRRASTTTG